MYVMIMIKGWLHMLARKRVRGAGRSSPPPTCVPSPLAGVGGSAPAHSPALCREYQPLTAVVF